MKPGSVNLPTPPEADPARVDEFVELVDQAIALLYRASGLTRADRSPGGVTRNDPAFSVDGPRIRQSIDAAIAGLSNPRKVAAARGYDLHRARPRPPVDDDRDDHVPTFDASGFGA